MFHLANLPINTCRNQQPETEKGLQNQGPKQHILIDHGTSYIWRRRYRPRFLHAGPLGDDIVIMGMFFLRGSVLTTNEHQHVFFTSAELSDDWMDKIFCWVLEGNKIHIRLPNKCPALKKLRRICQWLPLEGWRVPRLMGRDGWTPTQHQAMLRKHEEMHGDNLGCSKWFWNTSCSKSGELISPCSHFLKLPFL